MQKITVTERTVSIEGGEQVETYWVNAKVAKGLLRMADCQDVTIKDTSGQEWIEHEYVLASIEQDEQGRWVAEFAIEAEATEETFAGLIKLDLAMAMGLTDDQVEINWRNYGKGLGR